MLVCLPHELLCHVYQLLPQSSVNQVTLTCRSLHASALPTLYASVVLSFRAHVRQLESGFHRSDGILKDMLQQHTTKLVLKCMHSGEHRLLFDVRSLLSHLPHLQSLSLVGFHMLPVDYITPLLSLLPRLNTVSLQYCDLIADLPSVARPNNRVNMPTFQQQPGELKHQLSPSLTTLEFHWTDFSKAAITSILSIFPSITNIRLLANHNRHFLANNSALEAVQKNCPHIKDLEVSLQEVKEKALVDCITFYGSQLRKLSIRYYSPLTLFAITKFASSVQDLTVRFSLETAWYSSPPTQAHPLSSTLTQRLSRLPYGSPSSQLHQRHQQQHQLEIEQEICEKGALLSVLCQCPRLVRVQIESMRPSQSRDNLPPVIRNAMATVAQKRITLNSGNTPFLNSSIDANMPMSAKQYLHATAVNLTPATGKNRGTYNNAKSAALTTTNIPTRETLTTTTAVTLNQIYQQEEEKHHGSNLEISSSPYATEINNNNNYNNGNTHHDSGSQQRRQWKELDGRMETVLVLDNEQLKEIRSQAPSFV